MWPEQNPIILLNGLLENVKLNWHYGEEYSLKF